MQRIRRAEPDLVLCAVLAAALVACSFLLQGRIGFNLQDESFLWYGVVRTHAGELPLRDFRSYDPGRYLWCAAWASMFGDGLLAMRAAGAAFAALGMTCGLLASRRAVQDRWLLVPIGILLLLWMTPSWKLYEPSVAMIAVYAAVKWIESPSSARHVAAGVVVGSAAFFGRNLGLYVGCAFGSLLLYLAWIQRARDLLPRGGWLALGVVLGYSPMLAMIACAPDFASAFVDSILFYVQQDTLNATLPVPWPWRIDYSQGQLLLVVWGALFGLLFVLLPLVYSTALLIIVRARRGPPTRMALLIGACGVGAFWAHHVWDRADLAHLASSIHPLLLALLALPSALGLRRQRPVLIALILALLVTSFIVTGLGSPLGRRLRAGSDNAFIPAQIGSDTVLMSRAEKHSLDVLMGTLTEHVGPTDSLWVCSRHLGVYLLTGRRSPAWEIYPAWKASDALQQRLVDELEDVAWVLVDTRPLAGDESRQISRTHPLVWAMILRDFERVPLPSMPPSVHLARRRVR